MELQNTVFSILAVSAIIIVLILLVNRSLRKFDPLSEPKGLVLLMIMLIRFVEGMLKDETNEKITEELGPYIGVTMIYIFLSNISGLLSIEPPTANFSVTLSLAAITCILIEVYSWKYRGVKGYLKSYFEPIAVLFPINLISKVSTLASLSLRLFGNIVSGSILMMVIYAMLASVSGLIPVIGNFNFLGVIVAPALHFYFDLFAGLMQTYIFITLSITFIGKELPD